MKNYECGKFYKKWNRKNKRIVPFFMETSGFKTPHFSITGSFGLKPPSVPKITTKWFAEGGIMTSPTIFGEMEINFWVVVKQG